MSRVIYSVTATLPSPAVRDELLAWLEGGHVQEVVERGRAASGWITEIEGSQLQVEVIYVFRCREDLEAYERDHAPALRAEGVAKFVDGHGVQFARRVSQIVGRFDGPAAPGASS